MRALAVLGWWLASAVRLGELLFGATSATTTFVVGLGGGGFSLSLLATTSLGSVLGFTLAVFHNHCFFMGLNFTLSLANRTPNCTAGGLE